MKRNMSRQIMTYERLNSKYLKDAEEELMKGDYLQASEKLWGAAASIVKVVAMKRENKRLGEHRLLFDYVSKLDQEFPDLNLKFLFMAARTLHTNFYEDELSQDYVKETGYKVVTEFVDKMKKILK